MQNDAGALAVNAAK